MKSLKTSLNEALNESVDMRVLDNLYRVVKNRLSPIDSKDFFTMCKYRIDLPDDLADLLKKAKIYDVTGLGNVPTTIYRYLQKQAESGQIEWEVDKNGFCLAAHSTTGGDEIVMGFGELRDFQQERFENLAYFVAILK